MYAITGWTMRLLILAVCAVCAGCGAGANTPSGPTKSASSIVIDADHYYWGAETGSPLLTLQTNATRGRLGLRVCKGFGAFQNKKVDLRLLSYDPATKQKMVVTTFSQVGIDPQNPKCTNWVTLPDTAEGLETGSSLKVKVVSPSGPSVDGCANEAQCPGVPDNTYDSTARRVLRSR